jgi:formate dehydrogenase major subunit
VFATFHTAETFLNRVTGNGRDPVTHTPEYKVTAVQVTRVSQPSEWQRHFTEIDHQQHELLEHRQRERA